MLDAIQELEGLGLIAVVRRPGRASTYLLRRAAIEAMCPPCSPDDDLGDDDGDAPEAGPDQSATRTSPPHGPVRHTDGGSPPGGPHQSAGRTRTLLNLQELDKTPLPPQAGEGVVDDFQQFWDAYPRREARGSAERAWRRLNPSPAAAANILAALALQRQSAAWQREGGRFVPMPAKWLRNRRWADGAQSAQPRAALPEGWQDDPAQVKAVGASIGQPFSLAGLGNGWTDDERIGHYRRYRAQVIAAVQAREATA
ncbi:hypothetical protein ASF44_08000 [Pseudorhodoferax sp. Leaf274]|nr:hypothetical protein ASF44_08000 [Pseudorhodoferax sp. Leaf274]